MEYRLPNLMDTQMSMKLVGGFNPFEKYEFVSWDDYSQHMEQMLQTTNQDLIPSGYD